MGTMMLKYNIVYRYFLFHKQKSLMVKLIKWVDTDQA